MVAKSYEENVQSLAIRVPNGVISCDDESSGFNEDKSDTDVFQNSVALNGSSINIENSNDVVVGSLTQFHGPVTIYQNVEPTSQLCDGKDLGENIGNGKAKLVKTGRVSPERPQFDQQLAGRRSRKLLAVYAAVGFSILIAIIIITTTILLVKSENDDENPDDPNIPPVTPSGHKFFYRYHWGGRPPLSTRPLKVPTKLVIIIHTATDPCRTLRKCAPIMQTMQTWHYTEFKSPDVGYNFCIGGDGNIYVGRDWDAVNFTEDDCITISIIGNYAFDEFTKQMIDATKELLKIGVEKGKLSVDYVLVAHNQTYATDSPGTNVYKEISKWPHFDPNY